jgi:hypothetical protein
MSDTPSVGQSAPQKVPQSDPKQTNKIQRWDDIRRNQFGVALTTFIALATGGIGYCAKLIADEKVNFSCCTSLLFVMAAAAFGFGLIIGVFTTLTRLKDARLTARKHHRESAGATDDELDQITKDFEFWGKLSWMLLNGLVGCVLIGIVSITFCIGAMYHNKLFCEHLNIQTTKAPQAMPTTLTLQTNVTK